MGMGLTQVRQWRQKRVLMRPEAAFPYVFAAEGAQHPPKAATLNGPRRITRHALRPSRSTRPKPPRSPTLAASDATLNDPAQLSQKIETNLS